MFGLEDSRRYYVCQRYVRMNMGINGLSKLVMNELSHPLLGGDVFIFFGKSRQMVKLLCWDGDGFLLYQKRLERGTFDALQDAFCHHARCESQECKISQQIKNLQFVLFTTS